MAIVRTVFLALLVAFGVAPLAEAQSTTPLFISADMVRGPGGSGPGCVLSNRFMRKEEVAWRIRVEDATAKELDGKGLKSVVVELSDGQKFPARFGGHPPKAPTAYIWSTAWVIPDDYPTGGFQLQSRCYRPGRHQSNLGADQYQTLTFDNNRRDFRTPC
jgi:hypothetical protein